LEFWNFGILEFWNFGIMEQKFQRRNSLTPSIPFFQNVHGLKLAEFTEIKKSPELIKAFFVR